MKNRSYGVKKQFDKVVTQPATVEWDYPQKEELQRAKSELWLKIAPKRGQWKRNQSLFILIADPGQLSDCVVADVKYIFLVREKNGRISVRILL